MGFQLLPVHFACRLNWTCKFDVDVRFGLAVKFDETKNGLIALFGLLQREYANARIIHGDKLELAAQGSRMLSALKSEKGRAQLVCLPVRLIVAPVSSMSSQAKQNLMMSPVLIELVGVAQSASGLVGI